MSSTKNYGKGTPVIRDWVFELNWKLQTGLISSIRGIDAPDNDIGTELMEDCKSITKMLRYIILNDADNRTNFMSDRVVFVSKVVSTLESIKAIGKYNHWYDHIVLAMKTIGRNNPSDYVRHYYRQVLSMLGEIAEYDIAIPNSNRSVKVDVTGMIVSESETAEMIRDYMGKWNSTAVSCVSEEDIEKRKNLNINIKPEYPDTIAVGTPEWNPTKGLADIPPKVVASLELRDDIGEMYANEAKVVPIPTVVEWVDPILEDIINDRYSDNIDETVPRPKEWRNSIPEHKLDVRDDTSSILTIIDFVKNHNFKNIKIDSISPAINPNLFKEEDKDRKVNRIVVERVSDNKILWMSNEVFKSTNRLYAFIYAIDKECGSMFNANGDLLEVYGGSSWTVSLPIYSRLEYITNSSPISEIIDAIDVLGIDSIKIEPLYNYYYPEHFLDSNSTGVAEWKISIRSTKPSKEDNTPLLWISDEVFASHQDVELAILKINEGYRDSLKRNRSLPNRIPHIDIGVGIRREM
jgi:hypothetical protein